MPGTIQSEWQVVPTENNLRRTPVSDSSDLAASSAYAVAFADAMTLLSLCSLLAILLGHFTPCWLPLLLGVLGYCYGLSARWLRQKHPLGFTFYSSQAISLTGIEIVHSPYNGRSLGFYLVVSTGVGLHCLFISAWLGVYSVNRFEEHVTHPYHLSVALHWLGLMIASFLAYRYGTASRIEVQSDRLVVWHGSIIKHYLFDESVLETTFSPLSPTGVVSNGKTQSGLCYSTLGIVTIKRKQAQE